jgi:hypothetical protein
MSFVLSQAVMTMCGPTWVRHDAWKWGCKGRSGGRRGLAESEVLGRKGQGLKMTNQTTRMARTEQMRKSREEVHDVAFA